MKAKDICNTSLFAIKKTKLFVSFVLSMRIILLAILTTLGLLTTIYLVPASYGSFSHRGGTGTTSTNQSDRSLLHADYQLTSSNLTNTGPTWNPIGPKAVNGASTGSIGSLGIDWNNLQVMYASGSGNPLNPFNDQTGIYVTLNSGKSWAQADVGLASPTVHAIWVDQSNPSVAAAATAGGIYYTTNEGASWSPSNITDSSMSIVQVGTSLVGLAESTKNNDGTIYLSSDNGATWSSVWTSASGQVMQSLGGNSSLACAYGYGTGPVVVCGSPTTSWTSTVPSISGLTGLATQITLGPSPNNVIYVNQGNLMAVGTNSGTSWAILPKPTFISSSYNKEWQAFKPDPNNSSTLYATSGDTDMFYTTDGGSTWNDVGQGCDIRTIRINPANSNDIIIGSDLCLDITLSGPTGTWSSLASNMTNYMTYSVAANGPELLTVDQDNEPIQSLDGGTTWNSPFYGGEAGYAYINPGNPNYQYVATSDFSPSYFYSMSTNGGQSFSPVAYLPDELIGLQNDPSFLVGLDLSTCTLSESTNYGTTFADTGTSLASANGGTCPIFNFYDPTLSQVAVDPSNPSHILVITNIGLLSTTDNGTSWSLIDPTVGANSNLVAFDPNNSKIVVVGGWIYSGTGLWVSTDGGTSFALDITGINCPECFFNHIAFIPGNANGAAIITTSQGPFFTPSVNSSWSSIAGNSISLADNGVVIDSGQVYIATNGEGVIQTSLPEISTTNLPSALLYQPYSTSIAETGGTAPYTWSITSGSLPSGLSLNSSNGTLTGTPTNAGWYSFTVQITDAYGLIGSPANLEITVGSPNPYHSISPVRICDTRPIGPQVASNECNSSGQQTLGPGGILDIPVVGQAGIPSNATAVVANITATDTTANGGYLTLFPGGESTPPNSSNLNWSSGQSVANLTTVIIGPSGDIQAYNPFGSTDVIVDVEGYYGPNSTGTAGEYVPLSPSRICDTRPSGGQIVVNQCDTLPNGPIGQSSTMNVQVTGNGGVPTSGVSAVAINVTAISPTTAGYLTLFPTGGTTPIVSNLNFTANEVVPNRAIVKLSSSGSITVYNFSGTTNLAIDVTGYFTDGTTSTKGYLYTAMSPIRICDTRTINLPVISPNECNSSGPETLGSNGTLSVQITSQDQLPSSMSAVVANVTVTDTSANGGFLTLYPSPPTPTASDLNWSANESVSNLCEITLNSSGSFNAYNYIGSADVIVDVQGFYS